MQKFLFHSLIFFLEFLLVLLILIVLVCQHVSARCTLCTLRTLRVILARVQTIINNKTVIDEGIFKGINNKGALLLESDKGIKKYSSGEISVEGIY